MLLLDANLSPRLVPRLASLFPRLAHVREFGLEHAADSIIWQWSNDHGYDVVSADADFVALCVAKGAPPKVIHLERCDARLREIENSLRANAIRINSFLADPDASVLAIQLAPR